MILRSKDVVEQLAPHYAGAIVAAVAAAASAANAARMQAQQRRAAANAAQAQKQGASVGQAPSGGVATSLMNEAPGMMQQGMRIKDMIQGQSKPVAGAADPGLPQLPQGQGSLGNTMGSMDAASGAASSLQSAQPDLSQLLQQMMQNSGGGLS